VKFCSWVDTYTRYWYKIIRVKLLYIFNFEERWKKKTKIKHTSNFTSTEIAQHCQQHLLLHCPSRMILFRIWHLGGENIGGNVDVDRGRCGLKKATACERTQLAIICFILSTKPSGNLCSERRQGLKVMMQNGRYRWSEFENMEQNKGEIILFW